MTVANTTFNDLITFTRASTGTFTGTNGALQTAAINAPRFDYNPTTLAPLGFLVEESRTNGIRNNTMAGATVLGALPTNWTYGQLTTLSTEVISIGTEAGITYTDIRIFGTATTTAVIYFESNSTIAAVNAQSWASSVYVKLIAGTQTNTSVFATSLRMSSSVGTNLGFVPGSVITLPSASTTLAACRFSSLHVTNNASTAFVMPALVFNAAGAIDITLRIGLPQLELGAFATSVIPTTPTFTSRATTGTYVDSSGLIATAAINVARNQYNPANLSAPPFLLLEAAAENKCTYSQDFTQTVWVTTNATKTTGISDPAGGVTAATITATGTNGVMQNGAAVVVIGTTYTVSIWMRRRTGTGVVGIRAVENINTPITITSTWARYFFAATATQTNGRVGVYCSTIGDEIDIWGGQIELGTYPTSYYPTTNAALTRAADISTSAAVTRAADVASINTLSPWYNAAESTLLVAYSILTARTSEATFTRVDSGSDANRIQLGTGASFVVYNPFVITANVGQGSSPVLINPLGTHKVAAAVAANNFAGAMDGTLGPVDTLLTMPSSISRLCIGNSNNSSQFINGYLQKIIYYPQRLTNSELQALTS